MGTIFEAIMDFIKAGGAVMGGIALLTFVLWSLLLERLYYLNILYPGKLENWKKIYSESKLLATPFNRKIRESILSEAQQSLTGSLILIKTLIAICPLLGLLGTVMGMIEIFDVIALMGTANARMIASGVSKATFPTMAGMGISLCGILVGSRYERAVQKKVSHLMVEIAE